LRYQRFSTGMSDESKQWCLVQGDDLQLWCWVQGDDLKRIFRVTIKQSDTVTELKRAIQAWKPSFKQVDPEELDLWQFELPLPHLNNDSANRIKLTPPPLEAWREISDIWKEQPPPRTLNVILRRPAGDTISPSSSIEGPGSLSHECKDFAALWDTFWGKSAPECFIKRTVKIPAHWETLFIPEEETTFTYLELPNGRMFPCESPRILVTQAFMYLYDELCREDARWLCDASKPQGLLSTSHSTAIVNYSGTGKTTCLSYILVRRLQEKKPLFIQLV